MKKLIIILCFTLFSSMAFCQVSITGEIKNAPDTCEVSITYYNNTIEWIEVIAGKTMLDTNGRFKLSFKIDKPKIAALTIGSQYTEMFLLPNDSISFTVDFRKFDETIQYTGRGAADNNYMAADQLADFNKKANSYSAFNDADKYKIFEDSLEKANDEFLKAHDTPEFSPEFRKYITTNTKYRYINPRWMYKVSYVNKKYAEKPVPEYYYDFLKALELNDQDASENTNYSVALMRYLSEYNDSKTMKDIPDSLPDDQKKEIRISKDYNYRKSIFKDKVLDYQLTVYLQQNIGLVINNNKFAIDLMNDYKSVCKNQEYISIIDKIFDRASKLARGKAAPEFSLVNNEGKSVSLTSFKGKTVYIDFWATWCMPCKASLPDSRKLMEKFKDRNDIVFLYINVKDDEAAWKTYLMKENMEGVNLFANKDQSDNLFSDYNFNGIPHYVLIDKNGKLISPNANRPDKAEKSIFDAIK